MISFIIFVASILIFSIVSKFDAKFSILFLTPA